MAEIGGGTGASNPFGLSDESKGSVDTDAFKDVNAEEDTGPKQPNLFRRGLGGVKSALRAGLHAGGQAYPTHPAEELVDLRQPVEQVIDSAPVRNSIFQAIVNLTGHAPSPRTIAEVSARSVSKVLGKKIFGQALGDMLAGSVGGAAAKTAARLGLSIAGVSTGSVVVLAAAGAASGATTAVVREYLRQRREFTPTTDVGLRSELKNRLKIQNGGKLALAAGRGAVFGAVGGVVGGELFQITGLDKWAADQLSNLKLPDLPNVQLPEIKLPEVKLPFGLGDKLEEIHQASIPTETATGTPTPPETPTAPAVATATPTPVVPQEIPLALGSDADVLGPGGAPGLSETPPAAPAAAPIAPPAPEPAPSLSAGGVKEFLQPTTIHGHEVAGSVADHTLTYDGKPWVLLENGTKNIGHLFQAVGETGTIDQQALATKLQQATTLWAHGQLNPSTNPDLYTLFHLSNGTASIYEDLLDDDTFGSLKKLGIIIKK